MDGLKIFGWVFLFAFLQSCSPSLNSYRIKFDAPKNKKAAGAEAPEREIARSPDLTRDSQKPVSEPTQIEPLGNISFFFGMFLLVCFGMSVFYEMFLTVFVLGTVVLGIPGIILGIISVLRIRKAPEKYRDKAVSWLGWIFCSVALIILTAGWLMVILG